MVMMPAVRTDSCHENDFWDQCVSFWTSSRHSQHACLSAHPAYLSLPCVEPYRPTTSRFCVAHFFLKNLKGRVSERTLRNTERYALSRYLPHSHFFPNPSDFREKSSQQLFHKPTDMLSTIPTANVVRTIPYTNALENDECHENDS